MRVAGIIAEYNPFHEGHRYHIEETRRLTGADYVVVVMSGDFVQRGEPAIVDKYTRAKMALLNGADLVLEMPVAYASASAEYFAQAGVGILDGLGCVDVLSFGSEWGSIADYAPYVSLLLEEPDEYKKLLKEGLKEGKSFPKARAFAVSRIFSGLKEGEVEAFFREPNHILGLEYMKALKSRRSKIEPLAVRRQGSHYHEKNLAGTFSSAAAIRDFLNRMSKKEDTAKDTAAFLTNLDFSEREQAVFLEKMGGKQSLRKLEVAKAALSGVLPENSAFFLENYFKGETVSWDDLMPYLDYTFLLKKKVLGKYFGMNRDLTARFQKLFVPGLSFEELMERLHARQLADAALRRVLLHIVLHIKDQYFLEDAREIPLPYVRVLGFSKKAAPLLKEIRLHAKIDVLQRPVEGKKLYKSGTKESLLYELDVRSSDFYKQIAARKAGREPVSELRRQQIIIPVG